MLQTSSPSYILLSSLDGARRHAFTPGVWHTPAAAAAAAREQLAAVPGLTLLQDGSCGAQESVLGFDLLRLVVNVQGLGLAGYDAAAWLEEQHGIVPELATNKVHSCGSLAQQQQHRHMNACCFHVAGSMWPVDTAGTVQRHVCEAMQVLFELMRAACVMCEGLDGKPTAPHPCRGWLL